MRTFYIAFLLFVSLSISSSGQPLVYSDVAGIFYSRCTGCHHTNGGAPFPMMSYSETYPWASSIQYDLNIGKMPPWAPDTTYTRFLHERIITSSEKNAILSWINDGALAGDTTLAPEPPVYSSQYKLKGAPDLILKVPSFTSNGSATDAYNCFAIPTGLTSDRIIRAYEIVPSNPNIIHHIVVKVDTTGTVADDTGGACLAQGGQYTLDVYAPGGAPTVFPGQAPLKMGINLKAGSQIIMQVHYPPGSAGLIDSTEMRIYFYPQGETGIRPVYVATPLQNWFMFIWANTTPTIDAQYPSGSAGLPIALSVFGAFPHGHLVTKSITNYVDNGTTTIPLIRINNWDFAWQGFYTYRNLVKVPAGYTIRGSHTYDNTTNNPNNPNNPPVFVGAGEGTADEMFFDSFQYMLYQTGDELIDIGALLAADPLLNSVPKTDPSSRKSAVFPNPFTETTSLWIEGFEFGTEKPLLKIFDILGNEVHSRILNEAHEKLNLKLTSGVYFYTVRSGKLEASGKMIIVPH